MKIYTRKGDDGSTGLFYGGRVAKDETGPEAYGTVDEANSAIGMARAHAAPPLGDVLIEVQRELFVVGAELATGSENRTKLEAGVSCVTQRMVDAMETRIDSVVDEVGMPTEFVVPGGNPLAASLDLARTVVRRAERRSVTHVRGEEIDDSLVVPYLNRLADYLYIAARAAEGTWTPSREER